MDTVVICPGLRAANETVPRFPVVPNPDSGLTGSLFKMVDLAQLPQHRCGPRQPMSVNNIPGQFREAPSYFSRGPRGE